MHSKTIHNLFPKPVAQYELNRNLTEKEILFVNNQETISNLGNSISKDKLVLESKELIEIKKFIEESVDDYFKTVYNPKHNVKLKITQSWINCTKLNQYHHQHYHRNSIVSGVFYLKSDDQTDRINFYKNTYEQINFLPKEWNVWNSDRWWISVKTGLLIIFPSYLMHSVSAVENNNANHVRTSLAFNTFAIGNIGDELYSDALHIGEIDGAFR